MVYELKHPFSDGTTHVLFEPLGFSRSCARDISASVHVITRILEHRAAVDAPGAGAPPGASLH